MFTLEKFLFGLCKSTRNLAAKIEREEIILSETFRCYEDRGQERTEIVGRFLIKEQMI